MLGVVAFYFIFLVLRAIGQAQLTKSSSHIVFLIIAILGDIAWMTLSFVK